MNKKEKALFKSLKDNFVHYASKCLKIRTKEGSVKPFILNQAQQYLHTKIEEQRAKTGKVRVLILKGRQQGCSTYVGGRFYWLTTHRKGFKTFILAHLGDATDNLFKMVKRYHENVPSIMRPSTGTTNRKELIFDGLDSGYALGTAGCGDVGRSDTIQLLHGSEVAFWGNTSEIVTGVLQTVPDAKGTEVILESTANGIGNMFHQYWQAAEAGESDYIAVFIPWYWQKEYSTEVPDGTKFTNEELELKETYNLTEEQLYWRRLKIVKFRVDGSSGEWRFRQEYPFTAAEAFQTSGEDSLVNVESVATARKLEIEKPKAANIVGVDPARYGNDRTAIIRRIGRLAYDIEYHSHKDTMEVAGICANILESEKIDKMFIDIGGLGAGVVDRLKELGYRNKVIGINFGERALKSEFFANKRAEMWGEMAKWILEGGCSLPDSDSLHTDLIGPKFSYDSSGRLLLESKEAMIKRGIRSPDGADALALTFAYPVASPDISNFNSVIQSQVDFKPIGF